MTFQYQRVPRVVIAIVAIGTPTALILAGPLSALGFALGGAASLWNYNHLVKSVTGLTAAAASRTDPGTARLLAGFLLRLAVLGGGAIVILKYSRINPIALLAGLFAAFIAIGLELTYELLWKSAKSG
jgi:hypothetical protein